MLLYWIVLKKTNFLQNENLFHKYESLIDILCATAKQNATLERQWRFCSKETSILIKREEQPVITKRFRHGRYILRDAGFPKETRARSQHQVSLPQKQT